MKTKNTFAYRLSLIACLFTITGFLKAQDYDVQVLNTTLCGSTITGTVYDANNNVMGNFTCPTGSNNFCQQLSAIAPSFLPPNRVEFAEGTTCLLSISINTSPGVSCTTCSCTCMSSASPTFQSAYLFAPVTMCGTSSVGTVQITIQ